MNKPTELRQKKIIKIILSIGAAIIIFLGIGIYYNVSNSAYYSVSIDVNPSIELIVNKYGYVIDANAYNYDGYELLEDIDFSGFNNMDYEEASSLIIEKMNDQGYFSDEIDVVITSYCYADNASEELSAEIAVNISDIVESFADNEGKKINIIAESIDEELLARALELDISPGKLLIIERMITEVADTEDINIEDWIDASVKDIFDYTNSFINELAEADQNRSDIIESEDSEEETTVETETTAKNQNDNKNNTEVDTLSSATTTTDNSSSGSNSSSNTEVDTVSSATTTTDNSSSGSSSSSSSSSGNSNSVDAVSSATTTTDNSNSGSSSESSSSGNTNKEDYEKNEDEEDEADEEDEQDEEDDKDKQDEVDEEDEEDD